MIPRPGDRHVLHPGDKVMADVYQIPGIVLARFILTNGEIYHVVEHKVEKGAGIPYIYADKNLELVERGFEGKREDSAEMEVTRLREACSRENEGISQVLGKVLGYPWFKDDPANFPDATEADGVCVGEHVAISLADEAASKIARLREALEAAETFIADELECWEFGMPSDTKIGECRDALAKVRAALGKLSP